MIRPSPSDALRVTSRAHERMLAEERRLCREASDRFAAEQDAERRRKRREVLVAALAVLGAVAVLATGGM